MLLLKTLLAKPPMFKLRVIIMVTDWVGPSVTNPLGFWNITVPVELNDSPEKIAGLSVMLKRPFPLLSL